MRVLLACLIKWGDMSSGPAAVLVLMFWHAFVSCVLVNGSCTCSLGNVTELMVCCTFRSSLLLKFGSSGKLILFGSALL